MFCWLCNAKLTENLNRLVATVFHFWTRCCPGCTEKYGMHDAAGNLIFKLEKAEKA